MGKATTSAGRFTALLLAWLFTWQSWGFTLSAFGVASAASCCCAHKSEGQVCHCRACTHAREVASGEPLMKDCGGDAQQSLEAAARASLPPPALAAAVPVLPQPLPAGPPATPAEPPLLEVPTPPPLRA
jgi:hypothetical protein